MTTYEEMARVAVSRLGTAVLALISKISLRFFEHALIADNSLI